MTEEKEMLSITNSDEQKCATKRSNPEDLPKKSGKKKPTFVCVMCQQKFNSHLALKNHFRDHGAQKIDIRGRPIDQSTLLKHPSAETVKSNLIHCEHCSATFLSIPKAVQHKYKKHKAMENSFCEFCGKLFPLKSLLEQHVEKSHMEQLQQNKNGKLKNTEKFSEIPDTELKYGCLLCTATFVTMDALNFHIHGAHTVSYDLLMSPVFVPPPSTKIKLNNASEAHSVYYCHICGAEYILKHNLRKHIRDAHTTEEWRHVPQDIIRCKTCEALFYNQKAYLAHITYHNPNDWHVSSEEQRGKILSRVDQDFDIRRVPTKEEELVNNTVKRKSSRIQKKPSTSKSKQAIELSNDESMSPPSTPSDSEDEEISKTSRRSSNLTSRKENGSRTKIKLNKKKLVARNSVLEDKSAPISAHKSDVS